jgi:hypothetical protein
MSDKTNIFADENNESPLQVIRQTMSVAVDDDGTPNVNFATNRGKGSGSQTIPVADYAEVVSTLQEYADAGIEGREEASLSPAETIRRTIRVEDGMISFRVRSGKGSKPAKIPLAQFGEVCSLLMETVSSVEAAGCKLSGAGETDESDDSEDCDDLNDDLSDDQDDDGDDDGYDDQDDDLTDE